MLTEKANINRGCSHNEVTLSGGKKSSHKYDRLDFVYGSFAIFVYFLRNKEKLQGV